MSIEDVVMTRRQQFNTWDIKYDKINVDLIIVLHFSSEHIELYSICSSKTGR